MPPSSPSPHGGMGGPIPPPPSGYSRPGPPPLGRPSGAGGGDAGPRTASVPIEKVIDDVAVMGFSRDQVRGVLQELMAKGQKIDLNVVLDRLGAR